MSKRRVISIVGARPNFMKIAPIHRAFLSYQNIEHMIIHTGQHYDKEMSDTFFNDLDMPHPDRFLGVGSGSHAEQTAKIMIALEKAFEELKPDLILVAGDVNSTIAAALTAVKMGIKVAHIEAGLRSFDRTMPEEINRIATDAICDYCFVTEKSGYENLIKEGFHENKIYFVGNTMIDSQKYALNKLYKSNIIKNLGLDKGVYILVTIHRPSNVDKKDQLQGLINVFNNVSKYRKIVFPVHPRTKKNIQNFGLNELIDTNENLIFINPVGYIDFLNLMLNSDFVITDSGGIQEETTALGIPCITIRTTTERPITTELGTNILIQPEPYIILQTINQFLEGKRPKKKAEIPLWDGNAAIRIAEIINKILNQ